MKYIVEIVNKTLLFKIKKFESHDKNYIRFLKEELYVVGTRSIQKTGN